MQYKGLLEHQLLRRKLERTCAKPLLSKNDLPLIKVAIVWLRDPYPVTCLPLLIANNGWL